MVLPLALVDMKARSSYNSSQNNAVHVSSKREREAASRQTLFTSILLAHLQREREGEKQREMWGEEEGRDWIFRSKLSLLITSILLACLRNGPLGLRQDCKLVVRRLPTEHDVKRLSLISESS